MNRQINLATIEGDALGLAKKYGVGIELDQFCTAISMEEPYLTDSLNDVKRFESLYNVLHGPINELFPCAIDPNVRTNAVNRFEQAYRLCEKLDVKKLVLHSGFYPNIYFKEWYVEQSITVWQRFIESKPKDFVLCVENVMDNDPSVLVDVAKAINDPRFMLCLDIGHANVRCTTDVPIMDWVKSYAPYLGHVHLHNNDKTWDWHRPLNDGTLNLEEILKALDDLAPMASWTLEHPERSEESLIWLKEREYI